MSVIHDSTVEVAPDRRPGGVAHRRLVAVSDMLEEKRLLDTGQRIETQVRHMLEPLAQQAGTIGEASQR